MKVWIPNEHGRDLLGPVPDGCTIEVCSDPNAQLPSDPADLQFWVPPFLSQADAVALTQKMPALKVIQLMSAGADAWVGRVRDGVLLCDARGVHDSPTAEWVVSAILSQLREFPAFIRAQARSEWAYGAHTPTDELAGKRVLIVGAGSIGSAVVARLEPFEVELTLVARRPRPAEGVHGVEELPTLLPYADVVVLIVPLTEQTKGLVDAGFLAAMPDGALLVNASRGVVVDTGALLAELTAGRLRAALDVTDPEPLPPDHPLWTMPGVLITPHVGGSVAGFHQRAYRVAAAQIDAFAAGRDPANLVRGSY